jgi:hypothetical protein
MQRRRDLKPDHLDGHLRRTHAREDGWLPFHSVFDLLSGNRLEPSFKVRNNRHPTQARAEIAEQRQRMHQQGKQSINEDKQSSKSATDHPPIDTVYDVCHSRSMTFSTYVYLPARK